MLHRGPDEPDLTGERGDQFCLVAAVDHEPGFAEQRPFDRGLALVALGVDHPDSGRGDDDVIDVRARIRDASVMQHDDVIVEVLRQEFCDVLLAGGASGPGFLVLGFVLQGEQQAADTRVLLAGASSAPGFATCVLVARAGTRCARIRHRLPEVAHCDRGLRYQPHSLRAMESRSNADPRTRDRRRRVPRDAQGVFLRLPVVAGPPTHATGRGTHLGVLDASGCRSCVRYARRGSGTRLLVAHC